MTEYQMGVLQNLYIWSSGKFQSYGLVVWSKILIECWTTNVEPTFSKKIALIVEKNLNFRWKTTGKFNACFLGKTSLAKNFQKVFRVGGWRGLPTLLQDLCSTGKNSQEFKAFIKVQNNALENCWHNVDNVELEGLDIVVHSVGVLAFVVCMLKLARMYLQNWTPSKCGDWHNSS